MKQSKMLKRLKRQTALLNKMVQENPVKRLRRGSRADMYKILRQENNLITHADEFGHEIVLNPVKHFLKQKQYKNRNYNKVLIDMATKYNNYLRDKDGKKEEVKND